MFAEAAVMKHIAANRLLQLCAEAIVQDEEESSHLKICQECRMLLRAFAEDRAKYNQHKPHLGPDDKDFSKSA